MSILSNKSGMIPQRLHNIPMAKAKWTFQKGPPKGVLVGVRCCTP